MNLEGKGMGKNELSQGAVAVDRKRAYRKPETLSREQLEALAVICNEPGNFGKTDPGACPIGPIQS